jgi:hypothetical protein
MTAIWNLQFTLAALKAYSLTNILFNHGSKYIDSSDLSNPTFYGQHHPVAIRPLWEEALDYNH